MLSAIGMALIAEDMPGLTAEMRTFYIELVRSIVIYNMMGDALYMPFEQQTKPKAGAPHLKGIRAGHHQDYPTQNLLAFISNAAARRFVSRLRRPIADAQHATPEATPPRPTPTGTHPVPRPVPHLQRARHEPARHRALLLRPRLIRGLQVVRARDREHRAPRRLGKPGRPPARRRAPPPPPRARTHAAAARRPAATDSLLLPVEQPAPAASHLTPARPRDDGHRHRSEADVRRHPPPRHTRRARAPAPQHASHHLQVPRERRHDRAGGASTGTTATRSSRTPSGTTRTSRRWRSARPPTPTRTPAAPVRAFFRPSTAKKSEMAAALAVAVASTSK